MAWLAPVELATSDLACVSAIDLAFVSPAFSTISDLLHVDI